MQTKQDYKNDLAEIRSMMERSSRFLSLSGLAGILAGLYALAGAGIAYFGLHFRPVTIFGTAEDLSGNSMLKITFLALAVLIASLSTAIFLSVQKAGKKSETVWNASARRLLANISVPLLCGGGLILVNLSLKLIGLLAPLSLIFYGLALWNAGDVSFKEIRAFGILLILLGLISMLFIPLSIPLWALGFGIMHIIYGTFIYLKHDR